MTNKTLQSEVSDFIAAYGETALQEAMRQYIDGRREYQCRTRSGMARIPMREICYLEIRRHDITIHTTHGIYQKYGTLAKEWKVLAPYGFVRCSQSCIVSLRKIRSIRNSDILLDDGTMLHVSRACAPKVLAAFNGRGRAGAPAPAGG